MQFLQVLKRSMHFRDPKPLPRAAIPSAVLHAAHWRATGVLN